MKRMYALDFLKLYFAYVVAFFHFGTDIPPGPTVTVQIFFLFSGFFLARKYYTRSHGDPHKRYDQWRYTVDHVKGLYPMYLFSLAAFFFYLFARGVLVFLKGPTLAGFQGLLLSVFDQIPDLLLLQSAFQWYNSYNYPLWQLSALVIAGYFVYGMLCHSEALSRKLLFPAAILMSLSLLSTGVDLFANWGPIYIPLIRAFAPMCAGVLAYYFTTTGYYSRLRQHKVLFDLAVLLSLVTIIAYADRGFIFLVTTPIVLWGCATPDSLINRLLNYPLFRRFGDMSYSVYVNHALISRFVEARILPRLALTELTKNLLYFTLVTVYSIAVLWLVDRWKRWRKARQAAAPAAGTP